MITDFQIEAITKACSWAFGEVVYIDVMSKGGRKQETNKPHAELTLISCVKDGSSYVEDYDTDDDIKPRVEVAIGVYTLVFQFNIYSRNQDNAKAAAWTLAMRTTTRMGFSIVKDKWLTPNRIGLMELGSVNVKSINIDNRDEGHAFFEIPFTVVVTETDAAATGTWIESIDVTSDIDGMADNLQLNQEVIE